MEVVHNRTVNLNSGMGRNVAMDHVKDFLNAQFKGGCFLVLNQIWTGYFDVKYIGWAVCESSSRSPTQAMISDTTSNSPP